MKGLLAALAFALAGSAAAADPAAAPETAVVLRDRVALRGAAREAAQLHATLWQGDSLEVRGRELDYLKVYDHHRERAGYVRAADLRVLSLEPAQAPALAAVLEFLRDEPGAEALGIAYAAAFLKAAPPEAIGAEAFDALGTLAERLARRASTVREPAAAETVAAHLDVAQRYGVVLRSFEHEGRVQLCYDGEAFRRVLALPADAERQARAALALTRPDCIDPALAPLARHDLDAWRADVLDRVPEAGLPDHLRQRLRLRRASVWAALAFQQTRREESAQAAGQRALEELAGVDRKRLAESDAAAYTEAAIRVGASRWAAETTPPAPARGLGIALSPGEPGQTCIDLIDRGDGKRAASAPLLRKCTYATVWSASARVDASGTTLALAVQPLEAWRELWLFRRDERGWNVAVLPPGTDAPELGYIEFAGWVPGQRQLLVARETRAGKAFERHFEVIGLDSLAVAKQADEPAHLSPFYRWQDPAWQRLTVSLR